MRCFDYYTNLFSCVYVTEKAMGFSATRRALQRLEGLPVHTVREKADIPEEHRNSRTLFITDIRGETVAHCPGSKGHVCCNYVTVDLYLGCSLGCSYCIMKSYLNFEPLTVYVDTSRPLERLRELAASNRDRMVRVGTGEVGDSLLLDPLFELSEDFIDGLSDCDNVHFELKTKTDFVDHLLDLPRKGNTIIGFSLNPDSIIEREEPAAASLADRLDAARRALSHGYRLSFHFDPIIHIDNWEQEYHSVIRELTRFPADRIAWVSLGTFRYPPHLKESMEPVPYLFDEFVRCRDGKYRYLQKVRSSIYAKLLTWLRDIGQVPVYMCMESETVWKQVFGGLPGEIELAAPLFCQPRGLDSCLDCFSSFE
jgi:spore photoproduct lyase